MHAPRASLRRGRGASWSASTSRHRRPAPPRARIAEPLGEPRLDRRRPAHAHALVARLLGPAAELLDHAEAEGLGAIAVTDHNVFAGALEAVELARGRDLVVIPGEEVKTEARAR